ncbi:conjugal transfer protein TraF [Vibrio vulnificus]|uniref:conjugal transfer protein TraF n=1 Tax=Vibrio vulnificus TaxID=672 RepID=UPI0032EBE496
MKKVCSTAIFSLALCSQVSANQYYIDIPTDNLCEFGTGWANYCDPQLVIKEKPKKKPEPLPNITIIQAEPPKAPEPEKDLNDPIVWLEDYQKRELRARALMTMKPTQENVDAYRREFFNDTMDRGTLVSDYWRRGAWQNPEFDYTLKRPTGYLGKNEYDLAREETVNKTIDQLNERYGVFFVFRSTNPQSVKAAAVIDNFASLHDLYIRGVSIDGQPLSTWNRPWTPMDDNIRDKLNINEQYDPGFLLFDSETQSVVPIGYGVLAHDELSNRIYVLTHLEVGEDY